MWNVAFKLHATVASSKTLLEITLREVSRLGEPCGEFGVPLFCSLGAELGPCDLFFIPVIS